MDYKIVGARIRQERRRQELTQANVAEAADISEKYYANIERGASKGRLEIYYKISRALGVSLDELCGMESAMGENGKVRPVLEIESSPVFFMIKDCVVVPPVLPEEKQGNH